MTTDYIVWGWVRGDDPHWTIEGAYADKADAHEAAAQFIGLYDAVRITQTIWTFGELT